MEQTIEATYERKHFFDLFSPQPNGSLEPKTTIMIGGVTLGKVFLLLPEFCLEV